MPMVKNDGYGVFKSEGGQWWFKTYKSDDPRHGPFETRALAMEMLLAKIGFDVARDPSLSSTQEKSP